MSTDYFFTNKTNTEVKKLNLSKLNLRLFKRENNFKVIERDSTLCIPRFRNKENPAWVTKFKNVGVYRYIDNYGNWTWFYQDEEMTWAKDFGESNSEPLLDKIAEWLDINWHSEHSELPEIKTFIEQHDLWSAWREASHSHG